MRFQVDHPTAAMLTTYAYQQPLVLKRRGNSVSSQLASGQSTPNSASAGKTNSLSEGDLARADAALMANGHS